MNKIPCAVIKDLLPSYVDGLTSEESTQMIEAHISECEACREILDSMKEDTTGVSQEEKKEIDYLKKNRRRNIMIIFSSAAIVLIVIGILATLFVSRYMVGEYKDDPDGGWFLWSVQTFDNRLELDAWAVDDIYKFTGFKFAEREGVLIVEAYVVPSGKIANIMYGRKAHAGYTSKEPFHQIMINGRIVWNDGEEISIAASSLFINRHEYVGDAPCNARTARVLNIYNYLGPYYNELETEEEPYGWTITLMQDVPEDQKEVMEKDMRSFAYALIATTNNLDRVTWLYNVGGRKSSQIITSEDASSFLDWNIKDCYENVSLLNELVSKTGLDRYAYAHEMSDGNYSSMKSQSVTSRIINIVSHADEDIAGITVKLLIDGEVAASMEAKNVNFSHKAIEKGDLTQINIDSEFFSDSMNSYMELQFTVTMPWGGTVDIADGLRIPPNGNTTLFDIHIIGNAQSGFTVVQ